VRLSAPCFRRIVIRGCRVEAGSGVRLAGLVRRLAAEGLSGAEFLAGIPGTVGGAVAMNAGACGREIGSIISEVTFMGRSGNVKVVPKGSLHLGYRSCDMGDAILLNARVKLRRGRRSAIEKRIGGHLRRRRATQELTVPSAGCVFKNPAGLSAGALIDSCGLKGRHAGAAAISERHANFIVNKGGASFGQVRTLMREVVRQVKRRHGIALEPEIKIWE